MKRAALLLLCGLLAGCNARSSPVATAATDDDATCRSYGAAPGSAAYVQCRTSLAEGRANRSQSHLERCQMQGAGEPETVTANGVLYNTGPRQVPGC